MESRFCSRCKIEKELETNFYKVHKDKERRHTICKKCRSDQASYSYKHNINGFKDRSRRGERNRQLKRLYGISEEEWNKLFARQNGLCAICGVVPDRPCVDHDHTSGVVRGILCDSCNIGLGKLGDTVESVRKALIYLEKATHVPCH